MSLADAISFRPRKNKRISATEVERVITLTLEDIGETAGTARPLKKMTGRDARPMQ